jgi:predicted small secreted protein
MKRFVLTLLLLSFTTAFLGACHTIAGAGKDVSEVGEHGLDGDVRPMSFWAGRAGRRGRLRLVGLAG